MIFKNLFNHNREFVKILSSYCKTSSNINSYLSFNDSKIAYSAKSTTEIVRACIVFRLCSNNFFVDYNKQILNISRKLLCKSFFENIMKQTVYGHFVAGESIEDIKNKVQLNKKFGVNPILDYCVEDDIPDEKAGKNDTMETVLGRCDKDPNARTYFYTSERQCDENINDFKKCIDASSYTANEEGFIAVKLTSICPPQLLMDLSDILVQLQNIFNVFTENIYHKSSIETIKFDFACFHERLKDLKIELSYDEKMKWFALLDIKKDGHIDLFEWLDLKNLEYNFAKIFKIKDLQTGETGSLIKPLSNEDIQAMRRMVQRLDEIAEYAQKKNVSLMIDAEQSYFQPAIRRITLDRMRRYNKEKTIIFNTYQCYLKDALEHVNSDLTFAEQENFYFGAKLVRGAYMEQERCRCKEHKYIDPINPTFEDTTNIYYSSIDSFFQSILRRGKVLIMIASHNVETIQFAVKKLSEYSISPAESPLYFGQLLGMCDHITFTLGNLGYPVYKYMPYGPVEKVLPYLSRRALENRAVLAKSKEEQKLLCSEFIRRIKTNSLMKYPKLE